MLRDHRMFQTVLSSETGMSVGKPEITSFFIFWKGNTSEFWIAQREKEGRMKWVEFIKVRSIGGSIEILNNTIKNLMNEPTIIAKLKKMRLFRIENLDSDICIVLFHDGKKTSAGGSLLGLHLADALKETGLVNHEILIEIDRNWFSV